MTYWGKGRGMEKRLCEDPPSTATCRSIVRFAFLPWMPCQGFALAKLLPKLLLRFDECGATIISRSPPSLRKWRAGEGSTGWKKGFLKIHHQQKCVVRLFASNIHYGYRVKEEYTGVWLHMG